MFSSGISGSGGISTKGKRKPRQEEDEDYREFPQKKHKLYGKGVVWLILFPSVPGLYSLEVKERKPLGFDPWNPSEPFDFLARNGFRPDLTCCFFLLQLKRVSWLREWGTGYWEEEGRDFGSREGVAR